MCEQGLGSEHPPCNQVLVLRRHGPTRLFLLVQRRAIQLSLILQPGVFYDPDRNVDGEVTASPHGCGGPHDFSGDGNRLIRLESSWFDTDRYGRAQVRGDESVLQSQPCSISYLTIVTAPLAGRSRRLQPQHGHRIDHSNLDSACHLPPVDANNAP